MNQATLTGRPILYILWIGRKLNILIPNSRYYAKCKDDLAPLDYATMIEFGTISLVYYLLSPFQYDWEEKNLYFLPSLTLTLELEENPDAQAIDPEHPIPRLFIDLIDNPEDVIDILSPYGEPEFW